MSKLSVAKSGRYQNLEGRRWCQATEPLEITSCFQPVFPSWSSHLMLHVVDVRNLEVFDLYIECAENSAEKRVKFERFYFMIDARCANAEARAQVSLVPRPKQPQRRSLAVSRGVLQAIFAGVVWVWERDYAQVYLEK